MTKADYGTLKLLLSLISYLTFTNLGMSQQLVFKLPKLFKQNKSVLGVTSLVHSYLLIVRPIIFMGFLIMFFRKTQLNNSVLDLEWLLFGLFFLLSGWNNLFQNIFKSASRFDLLTNTRIINTIFFLFPMAILYYQNLLSIKTILFSHLISVFVAISYGLFQNKNYLAFSFSFRKIIKNIKFGFPITTNTLLFNFINTSTLWIISLFMKPEDTGIYSFALLIGTIFKVFPSIIGNLINPKSISYIDINIKNNNKIIDFINRSSKTLIYTNFIFMLASLLLFKLIINVFFPQYSEAWLISLAIIISEYIYTLTMNHRSAIIIKGKIKLLIALNLIVLIIQIILSSIFSNMIGDITFMGIPILLSFLLSNIIIQHIFYKMNEKPQSLYKSNKALTFMQLSASIIAIVFGLCLSGYFSFIVNFSISIIVIITLFISIKNSFKNIKDLNTLIN